MTRAELRRLIKRAGIANMSEAARRIGVARSHLYRWLAYDETLPREDRQGTPIDEANAMLIRSKLKPKRKKK